MSRQFWVEALAWATADGVAVANTTTETIIMPDVSIPANYMQDGRNLRLKVQGKHSTTGTPTLTFRLRWGGVSGTVIALSPAFTTGTGVTNNLFEIELNIQTRANGSSGTLLVVGSATVNGATVPVQAMCVGGASAPASTTVDLTTATNLSITAQWGTQSPSNTLTGVTYLLESLN